MPTYGIRGPLMPQRRGAKMDTMQPRRPGPPPPRTRAQQAQQAQQAQLAASLSGAVDLAAVRARNEAAKRAEQAPPPAAGSYVIDVTEASFQADVLDRSFQVPVVLDLWAEWCEPCKALSPVLERLAAESGGSWILAKVDVDANQRLAQALQVQSIPAVKAVLQGGLAAEFTGVIPEAEIRQFLTAIVEAAGQTLAAPTDDEGNDGDEDGEPEDPRLDAAEDAFAAGDLAAAEQAYQAILDVEPGHPVAETALSQVRMQQRIESAPVDAVARADAAPGDVAAACVAADVEVAHGRVEEGFERLLTVIRGSAGEDRDTARTALLELFGLIGDDDPLVRAARRKLTAALF